MALIQVLTRPGFDLRHHVVSLLSNGDLGWIQITNFLVTGLLFAASAVGMRRVLHPGRGGTWGPWLVGAFGVGLIPSGVFLADPMNNFPPGTPPGPPAQPSWHGTLHLIVGLGAYLALIVSCFVVARRFAARGRWGWTAYSVTAGVVFLAATVAIATWPNQGWVNVFLFVAAMLAFGWVSVLAARLMTELPDVQG